MSDYSGGDNLEVMAGAVNYNGFLTQAVVARARPGDRILDFGAGIGTFAAAIAARGHEVCCVEPDPRQAAAIALLGLEVHAALDQLQDASLDYIYTLNVLEHIDDDAATLRQLKAKLKPGGALLVYVPAFQILYSSMDRKVGHYRRYRGGKLAELARAAGLTVRYWRYVDCLGFFAAIAYRLSGEQTGDVDGRALALYDRLAFPISRFCDPVLGRMFGKNVLLLAENQ